MNRLNADGRRAAEQDALLALRYYGVAMKPRGIKIYMGWGTTMQVAAALRRLEAAGLVERAHDDKSRWRATDRG